MTAFPTPPPISTSLSTTTNINTNVIVLKIDYRNDIRRIPLNSSIFTSLPDLETFIRKIYSIESESIKLKYKDDEGDWISLASDLDLKHAALVVKKFFRIRVTCEKDDGLKGKEELVNELRKMRFSIERLLQTEEDKNFTMKKSTEKRDIGKSNQDDSDIDNPDSNKKVTFNAGSVLESENIHPSLQNHNVSNNGYFHSPSKPSSPLSNSMCFYYPQQPNQSFFYPPQPMMIPPHTPQLYSPYQLQPEKIPPKS